MKTDNTPAATLLPSRSLLWVCRVLCGIALSVSGYLAWTAFHQQPAVGCGASEVFDCSHVLTSEYAKVLGISVSVPAFTLYASLLVILAFIRPTAPEALLKAGWALITVGALSAGLAALWFTGIQVFKLEHLCPWCLSAHACGIILSVIVLWKRPLGTGVTTMLSGVSAASVAGLIAAQVMVEPPDNFTVERFDDVDSSAGHVASAESDDSIEFAAPEEFGAPVEFAPPGESDAGVFAPPIVEPPTVADSVFAPPVITEDVPAEDNATDKSADTPTPTADVESAEPDKDVTSAQSAEDKKQPAAAPVVVSSGALLFISPSTASTLIKLLSCLPAVATADEEADSDKADGVQAEGEKPHTTQKPVVRERLVTVAGKKFSLNTRHWPLLGDPDAKYIFVEMFDYTCPHCRNTHRAIDGAFEKLGDDLAVVALPVPIDPACNDAVRGSGHAGACKLASLSVAVWRCDRSRFREYHDWMFKSHRSYSQAKKKAEQLVGKEKLAAELALPHAENYVAKHVELYKRVGRGAVPKLMFPRSTMTGQVSSSTTLVSTIKRELGQ